MVLSFSLNKKFPDYVFPFKFIQGLWLKILIALRGRNLECIFVRCFSYCYVMWKVLSLKKLAHLLWEYIFCKNEKLLSASWHVLFYERLLFTRKVHMTSKITRCTHLCISPRKFPQNIFHEINDLRVKKDSYSPKIPSEIFLSFDVLG